MPPADDEFKNPISRSLSIILANIENDILMTARSYLELISLFVLVFVYDGFVVSDPDSLVDAEAMSEWVFRETNYRVIWGKKPLDNTIQLPEPMSDNVVAGCVFEYPRRSCSHLRGHELLFQTGNRTVVQKH